MKRQATALWKGALKDGQGHLDTQSGAFSKQPYSFKGRFEDENGQSGTNPEELMAAAHAGCFAMQLSHMLAENGTPAESLEATAKVSIEKEGQGFTIRSSALQLKGKVPGLDKTKFQELAKKAKETCPVSKAFASLDISLEAELA